jgi:multicomponent Na+:H+ antiporter subunit B
MSRPARSALALAALALLGLLAAWAVTGLPDFGHPRGPYATAAVKAALHGRHVTDTVAGVTFDVRGIDTLGEELILFSAATGATLLLRAQREEERAAEALAEEEEARRPVPASLQALGAALVGPALVFGIYVVLHGPLTPGGGFQGGVALAAALLVVFTSGQVLVSRRLRPHDVVEVTEALGAAAYALVAIGGLVFATAAMANFLPFGSQGSILSGGTIALLNAAVGVEVFAAVTLILTELLDQALLRHGE